MPEWTENPRLFIRDGERYIAHVFDKEALPLLMAAPALYSALALSTAEFGTECSCKAGFRCIQCESRAALAKAEGKEGRALKG